MALFKTFSAAAIAGVMASVSAPASAATIQGLGSPGAAVSGMDITVEDFTSSVGFSGTSLSLGGVTISSTGGELFSVSTDYAGQYNTTGASLQSPVGYPSEFRFDFATATDAFAFNFGASDTDWTIAAYSAGNSLIDSLTFAAVSASNAGEYFGISGSGISYALLTAASPNDYILLDNLTYNGAAPVPLPAAAWMLIAGLGGLVGVRRLRRAA